MFSFGLFQWHYMLSKIKAGQVVLYRSWSVFLGVDEEVLVTAMSSMCDGPSSAEQG